MRRGQEKQDISDSSQIIYIPLIVQIIGTYPSLRPKKAIRDPWAGLLTSLHRRARLLSVKPMAHCAQLHHTAAVLSENLTPFPLAQTGSPKDFRYSVFHSYYIMIRLYGQESRIRNIPINHLPAFPIYSVPIFKTLQHYMSYTA